MNDKIEDNPSHKKFRQQLEGAEALSHLTDFFSLLGADANALQGAFKSLPDIQKQFELVSKSPDKFNAHFSKKGWIAHESMNSDLMQTCIELAEKGQLDLAEAELINYYSSDKLQWMKGWLRGTKEFAIRYALIHAAYEDTIAERYHACIPVLLLVIDGGVNDVDRNKGFFAESTDVTAWDSIAAHSTGLAVLKDIFNDTRKRTTQEPIDMPYRHGILHGRDTNYANKTVAAKCWAALFAVNDWAKAVGEGKKSEPPVEPPVTLHDLKASLENYAESHKRNQEVNRKIDKWKARNIVIGTDIKLAGAPADYADFTPEKEAAQFIDNWKKNNYGAIAGQVHTFSKAPINVNKEAKKVRAIFQNKALKEFSIIKIEDCSPAITEVTLNTIVEYDGKDHALELVLRFIYKGKNDDEILIFGDKGGQWRFIHSFFNKIEFLY